MAWPSFAARLRRRHWAHLLLKWAPDRCTIATAAAIIGKDADDLGREVASDFDAPLAPSALVARDELVTALRRRPDPTR